MWQHEVRKNANIRNKCGKLFNYISILKHTTNIQPNDVILSQTIQDKTFEITLNDFEILFDAIKDEGKFEENNLELSQF